MTFRAYAHIWVFDRFGAIVTKIVGRASRVAFFRDHHPCKQQTWQLATGNWQRATDKTRSKELFFNSSLTTIINRDRVSAMTSMIAFAIKTFIGKKSMKNEVVFLP